MVRTFIIGYTHLEVPVSRSQLSQNPECVAKRWGKQQAGYYITTSCLHPCFSCWWGHYLATCCSMPNVCYVWHEGAMPAQNSPLLAPGIHGS
jgi:hypothetical protein